SSSSESSSEEQLTPFVGNDVKDYLSFLNTAEHYALSIDVDGEVYYSLSYMKNGAFGLRRDKNGQLDYLNGFLSDAGGVFPFQLDNDAYFGGKSRLVGGEYLLDKEGKPYPTVWNNEVQLSLKGEISRFLDDVEQGAKSYIFKNKTFLLHLLSMLGLEAKSYVEFDNPRAELNGGGFRLHLPIGAHTYDLNLEGAGTNIIPEALEYLSQGGSAFSAGETLETTRAAFKANNYTRTILDGNDSPRGYELFHPHYFYTEAAAEGQAEYGQGAIELENASLEPKLYGCYSYVLMGNLKKGFSDPQLLSTPIYSVPSVEEYYHYPDTLRLWSNLHLLREGLPEIEDVYLTGKGYYTSDTLIVYDFVSNFSIDQSYDPTTYIPMGLGFDITLNADISKSTIDIYYFLAYQGMLTYMLFPFKNFGTSNIAILDAIYDTYNA
ncbi:MAG: hypothetical protein HUJ60_04895, partial [Bacilli bacterium]|nr:hypothetical protein [Bacilli bacterium]